MSSKPLAAFATIIEFVTSALPWPVAGEKSK